MLKQDFLFLVVFALSSFVVTNASATVVQEITFAYNIDFVAPGEVWDVAGVDASDEITGTLRYDTMIAGTPVGGDAVDYNQTLSNGFVLNVGSLIFSSSDYDVRVTNDAFGFDSLEVFVNDSPASGAIVLGSPSQFTLSDTSGAAFSDTTLPITLNLTDFTGPFYTLPTDSATGNLLFASLNALSISPVTAVPEPASFAMLLGLAILPATRRRKSFA